LDICTTAEWDKQSFLPLRGHMFHRTQNGLWACCNPDCSGKKNTELDDLTWAFGALYMERREKCKHCGSQVFELVLCTECGTEYLAAEEQTEKGESFLKARQFDKEEDEFLQEFELETEETDEEDVSSRSKIRPCFLGRMSVVKHQTKINLITGLLDDETAPNLSLLFPEVDGYCHCPACSKKEKYPQETFRPVRLGAPFLLSVTIPTLLELSPEGQGEVAQGVWQGRRLITFSDSRQGTARFALKAQLDAQRNHVRSVIYHQVVAARPEDLSSNTTQLEQEIVALKAAVQTAPVLKTTLENKLKELETAKNTSNALGNLSWSDAVDALAHDSDLKDWITPYWEQTAYGELNQQDVPKLLLFQEFWRRPRRQNSLETLGLIGLNYPKLKQINQVPAIWKQQNLCVDDWRTFLKLVLNFFVRTADAVDVPANYSRITEYLK